MVIVFAVGDLTGTFRRDALTGKAVLEVGSETAELQSPWNPSTHFNVSAKKTWTARLAGHEVVVIKQRARLFGGLRDAHFEVFVDGVLTVRKRGL